MCFFDGFDICFWYTKLLYRSFENPTSFLIFICGAQKTFFVKVPMSFLIFVVGNQIHVFGEPRMFLDICFGAQKLCCVFVLRVPWVS